MPIDPATLNGRTLGSLTVEELEACPEGSALYPRPEDVAVPLFKRDETWWSTNTDSYTSKHVLAYALSSRVLRLPADPVTPDEFREAHQRLGGKTDPGASPRVGWVNLSEFKRWARMVEESVTEPARAIPFSVVQDVDPHPGMSHEAREWEESKGGVDSRVYAIGRFVVIPVEHGTACLRASDIVRVDNIMLEGPFCDVVYVNNDARLGLTAKCDKDTLLHAIAKAEGR